MGAAYKKLNFMMGQYAFINISNISLYEWHPFTIASGENESESYLQIQNEGAKLCESDISQNAQFTNLLYSLATNPSIDDIELHVDGPYGAPFEYDGYERIVLIGGGIGITPCHSIFSTLLSRSIRYGGKDAMGNVLPSIDLIWCAKTIKCFLCLFKLGNCSKSTALNRINFLFASLQHEMAEMCLSMMEV